MIVSLNIKLPIVAEPLGMKRYNQDQGAFLERFADPVTDKASQRLSTSSVSDLDMTPSMRYEILCMGLDRLPGADWADYADPALQEACCAQQRFCCMHCLCIACMHLLDAQGCWGPWDQGASMWAGSNINDVSALCSPCDKMRLLAASAAQACIGL